MLILTRRIGEKIIIGSNIEITLLSIRGGQVRLGVVAPKELSVHREEIYQKIEQLPNVESVSTASQESESH